MALKIRRGSNASRQTITPAEGELLYVVDHVAQAVSPVWVGDGSTAGGNALQRVVSVNSQTGSIVLTTDNVTQGSTNRYYLTENAQDDVASLFTNGTHTGGIAFDYKDTTSPPRIDVSIPYNGTVNSGSSEKIAFYSATGSVVSATNNLSWNNTQSTLTVDNGTINISAEAGPRALLNLSSSFNSASANSLNFNRSRGNAAVPTALTSGDVIYNINGAAWDGNEYFASTRINSYITKPITNNIAPSGIGLWTTDSTGALRQNLRVLDTGQTILGPAVTSETGTGQLYIVSTTNPQTNFFTNSVFAINTIFDGTDGQNFSIARSRGVISASTAVQSTDDIIDISFAGFDGTTNVTAAQITPRVDGAVSTGIVPGSLIFSVRNTAGVLNTVTKIGQDGLLAQTGAISSTVKMSAPKFEAGDGTASAPSIAFSTDASVDTGFFHPGDGIVCVSTNGVEKVRVDSGGMRVAGFMKVADVAGTLPSPPEAGMIVLDGTTFKGYNGTSWVTLN